MTIKHLARTGLRALNGAGGFLSRPRRPRWLYLTAFLLPVLIMGFIWAVCGVIPFGSKMILAHDQWHQYYPFYLDLRERLQNGQSLFHSWTTGMGTNYLSLFAYYLASPLNLPALILPDGLVMVWYNLMVLCRLGFAGLFCAFFLKKTFGREEFAVVAFSTAYAFCAFLMGYYWNAIWLDTVALLPLVTLGTFSLLRDRRYVLYTLSLALAVFCSYYIGLFICIWVVLLFIGWHVVNWDDLAGFWTRLWRIALFSLVAVGMTAALTIPAYLGLQSTSSAVNKAPVTYTMNIVTDDQLSYQQGIDLVNRGEVGELFSFFGKTPPSYSDSSTFRSSWAGTHESLLTLRLGYVRSFLKSFKTPLRGVEAILANTGTLTEPTTMEGLPNIFCGFFTLILAVVYLLCKRIPLRERIYTVLLLLLFANSFLFRILDYVWHGMHFPNMLPYRFSFLWSFTVIFMAFRAYTQLEHLPRWRAAIMVVPVTLLLYCVITYGGKLVVIASTAVALFALAALLLYSFRMIKKELFVLALCVCMLCESLGCVALGVRKVGFTESSYYPYEKVDTAAMVDTIHWKEEENVDLWRAEVALKQTLNDGTLLGYNGVSVFSSAANSRVSAFLQSIGMAASVAGNRYVYQEADPFTNLLLGIKYLIDRNDRNVDPLYFREIDSQGRVRLLENKAYLTLGYMVGDDTLEYDASQNAGLPFDRLNRLFREMTGLEEPLYESLSDEGVEAVGTAKLSGKTSTSFQVDGPCDDENYAEITWVMPRAGMLCVYTKSAAANDVSFFLNGEKQYAWADGYGYNRCMGSFREGDRISLRYKAKSGKTGSVVYGAALFDTELFDRAYEMLSERSMIPMLVTDTRVEGAVRVEEPGLLYLSIPNDQGWTLTVNGEPARITPVGDAMIAVHLEPGVHAVALEYETPGFSLGLKISAVCLAIFLVFLIVALISRFGRPPIVKVPVALADPRLDREEPAADAPPAAEPMPPRPRSAMPLLDMTQPWNQQAAGESEAAGSRQQATGESEAAGSRQQAAGESEAPAAAAGRPPEGNDSEAVDADVPAKPRRELLSTTGVFDPSKLPPENREPGSFESLTYLERLEKLLEEAGYQEEASAEERGKSPEGQADEALREQDSEE